MTGSLQAHAVAVVDAARAPVVGVHVADKLELRGLCHRFGARVVLDRLGVRVQRGEIFGLLGPNGCGKSTTLKVLTGLLVPDQGEILLDGQLVEPGGRELRRTMGVVFQSGSLDARLTARENLLLGARLYGIPAREARERADELLDFAGLRERAAEPVGSFSGGMRRRLELARALLHEPSLLVLDEPTTGLDESFFRATWQRIETLRQRSGLAVLLTTHRADEAERCDRIAVVDAGRVIAEDKPEALRRRVAGDVLAIEAADPEALSQELARRFGLEPRVVGGKVVIERERGHELIPRLVEALPVGRIASLAMHRPTLADVFVQLTGRSLGDEGAAAGGEA